MNGRLCTLVVLLLAVQTAACTSVPVIWPMSERPSELPHYPTAVVPSTPQCDGSPPSDPNGILYCAQQTVVTTEDKFVSEQRAIAAYKNGNIWALFGLGTAAGENLATSGSKGPLRTFGLIAAGLLGLNTALGVDGQYQAFGAAVTSIECLKQVDAALDAAKQSLALVQVDFWDRFPLTNDTHLQLLQLGRGNVEMAAPSQLPALATPKLDELRESRTKLMAAIAPALSGPTANPLQAVSAASALTVSSALTHIQTAASSSSDLRQAVNSASDPTTRAQNLTIALNKIKQTTQDALYKSVDLNKIFDAEKSALQQVAGNPVAQAKKTSANVGQAQTSLPVLKNLMSTTSNMDLKAHTQAQINQLAATKQGTAGTQKLVDTYDSCFSTGSPQQSRPSTNGQSQGDQQQDGGS